MPKGKGTYGSKKGRPPKKGKVAGRKKMSKKPSKKTTKKVVKKKK